MKRQFFLISIMFTTLFSCIAEDHEAARIVENYLNEQIHSSVDDYYTVQSFYHPDLAFPPGENQLLRVVSDDFQIIDVSIENMNINIMDPKKEEIVVVTVRFETFCDVINDKLRDSDFQTRKYYLSKHENQLLILNFTNPKWKTNRLLRMLLNGLRARK